MSDLETLWDRFSTHPDRRGDYLSLEEVYELIRLQHDEIATLEQWVDDCQSGNYVNCVYCGHRYGPDDEVKPTMQQALYEHIAVCPKHPLSQAKSELASAMDKITVMEAYDAKKTVEIARLKDEIADLKDCKDSLRDLGDYCGCDHCESPDERHVQVRHIKEEFSKSEIEILQLRAENQRLRAAIVEMDKRFGHFAALHCPTADASPTVLLGDLAHMVREAAVLAQSQSAGDRVSEVEEEHEQLLKERKLLGELVEISSLCRKENERLRTGILEVIPAFHDERSAAFCDTWWLRDGVTVYEHMCGLLPDDEAAGPVNKRRCKMTCEQEFTQIRKGDQQVMADVMEQNAELQAKLHLVMNRLLDIIEKAMMQNGRGV